MGRPRKQPRRIVTFNLNIPLAEAIDDLPVKNRSEWMNKQLPALLQAKEDASELRVDPAALVDSIPSQRLAAVLLNRLQMDFSDDSFKQLKKNLLSAIQGGELAADDALTAGRS